MNIGFYEEDIIASNLSNFAKHYFILDGVPCNSMEGLLKAIQVRDMDLQKEICLLHGLEAKRFPISRDWKNEQTLFWQGTPMLRKSEEYKKFLAKAYLALLDNSIFRVSLKATGGQRLTHTLGSSTPSSTVLTEKEFIAILYELRRRL